MTRQQLVRAHFDVFSDLAWAKDLEPKFRSCGLSADEMRPYRDQWNAYSEKRDWDWWQNHTKNRSDASLRAEIAERKAAIKALDTSRQASGNSKHQAFQRILGSQSEQPAAEPTRTHVKTPER